MNIKILSFTFIGVLLFFSNAICQNKLENSKIIAESNHYLPNPKYPDLFKTIPLISDDSPEWVKLLYSSEPNYFQISDEYEKYYKTHPLSKNTNTQNYKYFSRIIDSEQYLQPDGSIYIPTVKEIREKEEFLSKKYIRINSGKDIKSRSGNWTAIGPFETYNSTGTEYKSAQVNVYAIDQSPSDPNVLYAGSEGGGLFKSTDKGLNWSAIGQDLSLGGIGAIEVDPVDENIVYVGQGNKLYKSTDGGMNWNILEDIYQLNITDISINPDDHNVVMTAGKQGLRRSSDGGNSWNEIISDKCWDIELKTDDPNTVFVAKSNNTKVRTEIWKSTDNGLNFTAKTNGWYEPVGGAAASNGGARIGITDADPNRIYVVLIGEEDDAVNDNNYIGIYRSDDAGESWSTPYDGNGDGNPDNEPGGPYNDDHWCLTSFHPTFNWGGYYNQGFYDLAIDVSDTDPDKFLVGSLNLFKSDDGGTTYTGWGGYFCENCGSGYRHPDIQEIEMNGEDIWVTNDGGIDYYNVDFEFQQSRTKGINGSAFWGLGQGWNQDVVTGGRYHNGNSSHYENYGEGKFLSLGGAEAATGYVNQGENLKVQHSDISAYKLPESLTGGLENISKYSMFPNESYYVDNKSEIVPDPRSWNILYLGKENVLYKSMDGGNSFDTLHVFGSNTSEKVLGIEIPRHDPGYIYVVQKNYKVWKSTDAGDNWTQLALPASTYSMYISVRTDDENSIYLALTNGGTSTNKIFHSSDGGSSWTNISDPIFDEEQPKGIHVQDGTDGGVYVVTTNKVYYRNNSLGWKLFSDGLPAKFNYQALIPFYRDEKVRMATENKALWESPFFESSSVIAQPMVDQMNSYCVRDTLHFEDYSIRKEGATWTWSFSPAPQYVNSTTIRNPMVVFGDTGTYDVTLTVTNPGGQSDTKTIQDMVHISNECNCDTVPGRAVKMDAPGDYVTLPDVNINTNEITFTAWIKPNGSQNDYTGIVFNDGDGDKKAGMNFRYGKIAYHWPDGAWWWDSGLDIPSDEWSYVALIARPSGITLFVNGDSSTHSFSVPAVDFNTMKFGSYNGWSSRNFKGEMDEVCIFDTSLTVKELQDFMHLTKNPLDEQSLVHYYQFNRSSGVITDRVGTLHANFHGNAYRVKSTAPVGGGVSQRMNISGTGIYDFDLTGLKMKFGAGATVPDGDVVVSRLNVLPDTTPLNLLPMYRDYYWILSNYGNNSTFTEPDSLWLSDLNFVYDNNPEVKYMLYSRNENKDSLTWSYNTYPSEIYGGVNSSMVFTNGNSLTKSLQLLIMFSANKEDIIWNGFKWRGGSGINNSPGINDNSKNINIMPGNNAILLENANCKNIKLFENAIFQIPAGLNLDTHGN